MESLELPISCMNWTESEETAFTRLATGEILTKENVIQLCTLIPVYAWRRWNVTSWDDFLVNLSGRVFTWAVENEDISSQVMGKCCRIWSETQVQTVMKNRNKLLMPLSVMLRVHKGLKIWFADSFLTEDLIDHNQMEDILRTCDEEEIGAIKTLLHSNQQRSKINIMAMLGSKCGMTLVDEVNTMDVVEFTRLLNQTEPPLTQLCIISKELTEVDIVKSSSTLLPRLKALVLGCAEYNEMVKIVSCISTLVNNSTKFRKLIEDIFPSVWSLMMDVRGFELIHEWIKVVEKTEMVRKFRGPLVAAIIATIEKVGAGDYCIGAFDFCTRGAPPTNFIRLFVGAALEICKNDANQGDYARKIIKNLPIAEEDLEEMAIAVKSAVLQGNSFAAGLLNCDKIGFRIKIKNAILSQLLDTDNGDYFNNNLVRYSTSKGIRPTIDQLKNRVHSLTPSTMAQLYPFYTEEEINVIYGEDIKLMEKLVIGCLPHKLNVSHHMPSEIGEQLLFRIMERIVKHNEYQGLQPDIIKQLLQKLKGHVSGEFLARTARFLTVLPDPELERAWCQSVRVAGSLENAHEIGELAVKLWHRIPQINDMMRDCLELVNEGVLQIGVVLLAGLSWS